MNLDVFEYDLDHQMGIYGSVPFLQAHTPDPGLGPNPNPDPNSNPHT
jgi:hypothetical protein